MVSPFFCTKHIPKHIYPGYDFDEDPGLVDLNPALDFVVGSNDVAPAIDRAVRGMALGDRREVLCGTDEPLFGRYAARKLRWINGETRQMSRDSTTER